MGLLVFIAVVIIVLALVWILIDQLPMIESPFKMILRVLAILGAIIVISHRAGYF